MAAREMQPALTAHCPIFHQNKRLGSGNHFNITEPLRVCVAAREMHPLGQFNILSKQVTKFRRWLLVATFMRPWGIKIFSTLYSKQLPAENLFMTVHLRVTIESD